TRVCAEIYITPFTTIGTSSELPPAVANRNPGGCSWKDHALASVATFVVSIWVRGEYLVPARSRLNIGQSPGGAIDVCANNAGNSAGAIRMVFHRDLMNLSR